VVVLEGVAVVPSPPVKLPAAQAKYPLVGVTVMLSPPAPDVAVSVTVSVLELTEEMPRFVLMAVEQPEIAELTLPAKVVVLVLVAYSAVYAGLVPPHVTAEPLPPPFVLVHVKSLEEIVPPKEPVPSIVSVTTPLAAALTPAAAGQELMTATRLLSSVDVELLVA
jgi:hypothetical protein